MATFAEPMIPVLARRALTLGRWLIASMLLVLLGAGTSPARASGVNGLWTSSGGDFVVFMQDATSGATFALQVPGSFDALRVWLGTGSSTAVSLQGLNKPSDLLDLAVSGATMSGTMSLSGVQQPFNAQLALAWVATEYAGVWQKAMPSNAYIVFCVLNTGDARVAVQIDVTINADKTYGYDIFTGALVGDQFSGVSIAGTGLSSRLEFTGSQLTGSYTTVARPPKSTAFTATQIVRIAP